MPRKQPAYARHPDTNNRLTNDGMTCDEIAKELGLSHATICRIEAAAIRKMRIRMGAPFKARKTMTKEQLEKKVEQLQVELNEALGNYKTLRENLADYADKLDESCDEVDGDLVANDLHHILDGGSAV